MSGLEVTAVVDRGAYRLDVELAVAAGETVAVLGPSGAGKSTLLDVIAGLAGVTSGHVRVGGRELTSPRQVVAPQRRRGRSLPHSLRATGPFRAALPGPSASARAPIDASSASNVGATSGRAFTQPITCP